MYTRFKKMISADAQVLALNKWAALGLMAALSLSACTTTPNNAPVIDRTEAPRAEPSKPAVTVLPAPVQTRPVTNPRHFYTVKKGDSLIRIAIDHGQSYSDLVAWNNLKNPNDIKVDQVLRVSSPDSAANSGNLSTGGALNSAVQTSGVTNAAAGIEVRPLAGVSNGNSNNSANATLNKTSPRGEKRAYSEANFAELQKADSMAATVNSSSVSAATPVIVTPVQKNEGQASKLQNQTQPQTQAATTDDNAALEWIWPTEGKLIAGFDGTKNKGLDIAGKAGQDILAASSGKVLYVGSGIRGYGNLVIIKHNNDILSAYAHNKENLVKQGQTIQKGQKIAEMGNTDSDTVKLHFEIRRDRNPLDPAKFLPARE